MPHTVLLTGANGLLGQKIVELLAPREDVNLLATGPGPNRNGVKEGYEYASLDITDHAAVRALLEKHQVQTLINSAAMTHVDKCELDPERCFEINTKAVENMVKVCGELNIRLIHISTDFIFDGTAGPYREEDEGAPLSHYGQSKFDAEQAILNSGIRAAIVRTVLIYGVVSDGSRSNIVLWAKGALEKGDPIKVVNDQFRSPTLAEDLADGVVRILDQNQTGIFHLSGKEQMCITDIVRGVGKFWGLSTENMLEIDSATLAQPAKRPPVTGFVIDKAREVLGYEPHSFEEGLAVVDGQLRGKG